MKKIKTILLLLCGINLFFAGCEDNRKEYLDDYQTQVYFRNGGDQTLKLYRVGENTVYEIPVCKSGLDRQATGVATISVMEQSQLDMYNLENATRYRQLPDSCFRFLTETDFTFRKDEDSKVIRVEIMTDDVSTVQESDTENEYVLALQVRADKTVSSDLNLLILHLGIDIPYLSLGTVGVLSYSYTSESPDENPYANTVVLGLDNLWDFTCGLAVRDQAWLDAYNAKYETNYVLLPAENYTLPESVSFTAGNSSAAFEVSVNRQGMALLTEFVVPVYIASCSKPQFMIDDDEEASTVLLNVRLDPDKISLTEDMASSPYTIQATGDGTGLGLKALFDGEVSAESYWHSSYGTSRPLGDPVYGYYIDLELKKELSVVVFRYATRSYANAVPEEICIGVSDNGEDWTEIGRVSSDLPTGGLQWATLPPFSHTTSFKHVRFGVVRSAGLAGGVLADPGDASTALSELELYGANLVD